MELLSKISDFLEKYVFKIFFGHLIYCSIHYNIYIQYIVVFKLVDYQ